jgi:hypothetical protein
VYTPNDQLRFCARIRSHLKFEARHSDQSRHRILLELCYEHALP